ncbi:hypothetical protein B7Z17_04345, partial [Candidatus Saccharibacteria bacterium 32-49-10]
EDGKPEGLYIAYALDPETIRHRLGDDEVETGVPVDIVAGARGHQDHEGNVVGYSALPILVADIDHNIQPIAAWEGVVVLESIMQKRMLVAIDGSSRMTHEGLEKFNAIREAMKALKQEHARHPITGKLERLTRALAGADERTFKDLGQSKLMRSIGSDIVSMYESDLDTSRAMTALDEILSSRAVQVDGAVYADAEDEDSERAEVPKDAVGNMAFKVLSVGNDIFDHQPLFTMRDAAGAVYYARFDSIRTMRF